MIRKNIISMQIITPVISAQRNGHKNRGPNSNTVTKLQALASTRISIVKKKLNGIRHDKLEYEASNIKRRKRSSIDSSGSSKRQTNVHENIIK